MSESARVRKAGPGLTRRQIRRQLLLTLLRDVSGFLQPVAGTVRCEL